MNVCVLQIFTSLQPYNGGITILSNNDSPSMEEHIIFQQLYIYNIIYKIKRFLDATRNTISAFGDKNLKMADCGRNM
jgi:hypothetical protein